jgi:hypothetical protein
MAYNVLKGSVEGSVDQHADQEIGGVKVFKNTVSASVFYDTDAQSPCATVNRVAIEELAATNTAGILTYEGNKIAKAHRNLVFDGRSFKTDNAVFNTITGSAGGLTNIPADQFAGKISGDFINAGLGLEASRTQLKIKKHDGIKLTDEGLSLDLAPNGGVKFNHGKLQIDPTNAHDVTVAGQNISDEDTILIYDASRAELCYTTFKNLYDSYVSMKIPHAAGSINAIQIKGRKTFESSENFTYDLKNNTLTVKGNTNTLKAEVSRELKSNGETHLNGSVFKSIKTINYKNYEIQSDDNTVLLDTTNNSITVTLPPAKENYGRVINIKTIAENNQNDENETKYSVKIKTDGELIDFTTEIVINSSCSSRTLHSDGANWWVTSANGS